MEVVQLVFELGRRIYAKDSLYLFLGKRELAGMGRISEKLNGITLVLNPRTHEFITCFRNPGFLKKIRYKK